VTKTIVLKEAQATYTVDPAQVGNETLILERDGKPVAAVIPFEDYEQFTVWQKQREAEAWQRVQIDALADEKTAYERLQSELLKTHRGRWVAIRHGVVVDSDADQRALVKRVYRQTTQRPIYFAEVRETPRVYEAHSLLLDGKHQQFEVHDP